MAVPQAPLPLSSQVASGSNISITVVLQGLSSSATGFVPGTTYNSGNPTATFVFAVPSGVAGIGAQAPEGGSMWADFLDFIDIAWREGAATVS